jgi:hypothetical protein
MAATPGEKLTICAFGLERLITISASVAGGVIACYQLGYGIAAFEVGPLRTAGSAVSGGAASAAGQSPQVTSRIPGPRHQFLTSCDDS